MDFEGSGEKDAPVQIGAGGGEASIKDRTENVWLYKAAVEIACKAGILP